MHCTDMCPANKKKDLGGLSDVPNTAMYLISYFFSTFTSLSCKNRSTKHIITTSIFCSCQNRGKKIRKEKKKERRCSVYSREIRNVGLGKIVSGQLEAIT